MQSDKINVRISILKNQNQGKEKAYHSAGEHKNQPAVLKLDVQRTILLNAVIVFLFFENQDYIKNHLKEDARYISYEHGFDAFDQFLIRR